MDVTLRAKKILIRGGEFYIGEKDTPYTNNGKIILSGSRNEPTIAIEDQGIEAGSKIIANIGRLNFYGSPRKSKMTRLKAPAAIGDTTITVETTGDDGNAIDFKVGDRIAIAPTDIKYDRGETRNITAISGGTITLDSALTWYHFGAASSTKSSYENLYSKASERNPYTQSVDIRGEVVLLTRNI
jgi:hypothetical protein